MSRNWLCPVIAAAAVSAALVAPQSAKAETATFPFKNASAFPIVVVMDNEREVHPIDPGGSAVFIIANVGDRPTFRVYARLPNGQRGAEVANGRFGTVTVFPPRVGGRDLTFDGSSQIKD